MLPVYRSSKLTSLLPILSLFLFLLLLLPLPLRWWLFVDITNLLPAAVPVALTGGGGKRGSVEGDGGGGEIGDYYNY